MLLAAVGALWPAAPAVAAPGAPDPSFGSRVIGPGIAIVDQSLWSTETPGAIGGMALGPGGTIVIAGSGESSGATGKDFLAARLLDNGRIDKSFGTGGTDFGDISGDDEVTGVAVDQDGSVYFVTDSSNAGTDNAGIAKVQPNGSFDTSFAGTGHEVLSGLGTNSAAFAIALQRDDKIVVAGYGTVGTKPELAIARLLPNGNPDPTFGTAGQVFKPLGKEDSAALALALDQKGRIVVAGFANYPVGKPTIEALRLEPSGKLDHSFGSAHSGVTAIKGVIGLGSSVALTRNGEILVGNAFGNQVARLTAGGVLDRKFGKAGVAQLPLSQGFFGTVRSLAVQSDGKVVAGGLIDDNPGTNGAPFVARLTAAGKLDQAFGNRGFALFDIGGPPLRLAPLPRVGAVVAIQPNGRILAADDYTIAQDTPPNESGFFVKRFVSR